MQKDRAIQFKKWLEDAGWKPQVWIPVDLSESGYKVGVICKKEEVEAIKHSIPVWANVFIIKIEVVKHLRGAEVIFDARF